MHELVTERLIIRNFQSTDLIESYTLFTLKEEMRLLGLAPALTRLQESKERLKQWMEDEFHYAIVLKETGEFIGYITIDDDSEDEQDDTKELGFCLLPQYRHHGYMRETIENVLKCLKEEGVTNVWACCFKENLASKKLIENCGFEMTAEGTYYVESENRSYEAYEFYLEL